MVDCLLPVAAVGARCSHCQQASVLPSSLEASFTVVAVAQAVDNKRRECSSLRR